MVQAHAYELLNKKEQSMSDNSQHPLFIATKRLVNALDRLENKLKEVSVQQQRDVRDDKQLSVFEKENVSLRHERDNLNSAITQLETQYGDLHKAASTIYNKLDDSIKRLTQLIDE